MRRIGIITNRDKDKDLKYTRILVNSIIKRGGEVKISSDIAKDICVPDAGMSENEVLDSSEMLICLGGDGTFLKVARKAYEKKLPILGINLGNLGFLTEVEKSDIDNAVECVINNKYEIENRMMLEASVMSGGKVVARDVALNDIVISRGAISRILHLKMYINDIFADSFPGDGLIVSSPTGSTAYSLSAGGPIVEPDINLIIMTPICPHILYSRSFITTGSRIVRVDVDENYHDTAMVTVDGQKGYEVRSGDSIEIKKASQSVELVRINPRNFFHVLRSKIYTRGES